MSIRYPKRERDTRPEDEARINERIRAREIRVVDVDGTQLGVMTPFDAIQRAVEQGLDLVEVAPGANPPVCRIMDYGKHKYELKKKAAASKAKAHAATLKEVKLRPRTDDHDLDFKLRNARRFLIEGDKVKVTLMFRGREIVHTSLGFEQLNKVKEILADIASVENSPRLEGRFMSMILVPNREAIARLERARAKQNAGEADAADGEETSKAAGDALAAGES
jgi:translation initiation factor IF-3